jgi:UTP--glucose-1-phosphate uridylyltransferase
LYEKHQCSILGVQQVAREHTPFYGIVVSEPVGDRVSKVTAIVEKPKPEEAPSTLAVVGRYILTPRIFELLREVQPGAGGEIQLTDAIAALLKEEPILAYEFEGTRYDCGSKLGYLKATMDYALKHPEVGAVFRDYLTSLHCDLSGKK